jgi:hypothetical protein
VIKITLVARIALILTILSCLWSLESRGMKPLQVVSNDGSTITELRTHKALIIGNSNYSNGWQPLLGVQDDVKAVSECLAGQGFDVQVETNLTRLRMDEVLTDFISNKGQDESSRVLFYYAGHGQTMKNQQGQETGYLVPVDAPLPSDRKAFIAKGYPIQRLKIQASELGCRHALFIFDSCFSGSLFAPLRGQNDYVLEAAKEPVRMFITSGSANEQVPDHSFFREELVAALTVGTADANGDGYVTGSELGVYLRQQVVGRSKAAGTQQTPQAGVSEVNGLNKGDFIFQVPGARSARTSAATAQAAAGPVGAARPALTFEELLHRRQWTAAHEFIEAAADSSQADRRSQLLESLIAEGERLAKSNRKVDALNLLRDQRAAELADMCSARDRLTEALRTITKVRP